MYIVGTLAGYVCSIMAFWSMFIFVWIYAHKHTHISKKPLAWQGYIWLVYMYVGFLSMVYTNAYVNVLTYLMIFSGVHAFVVGSAFLIALDQ